MSKIKILDCTLRDGGYVNNWDFGCKNIDKIISNLVCANIDYIECGFIKSDEYLKDKTFFNSFNQIGASTILETKKTMFCLMINYGEVPIECIPNSFSENFIIRVVFKKIKEWKQLSILKNLWIWGIKLHLIQ